MTEESRNELHVQFVLAFAAHDPAPHAVSESELAGLAKFLTTHLPASYSQFLRRHGPVFCPTILRLTLDHGLDHPDLRQILTPQLVLQRSRELWCQQLPVDLFAFASDCMGNAFCFRQSKTPQDDAPVMFFSRQADELMELGETFDELLQWYVQNLHPSPVPAASP